MGGRESLEIDTALERVLSGSSALEGEEVRLSDARGRFLAQTVNSLVDLPGFDNSAMDGYAVRAADTAGATADSPVILELVGESRAGTPWQGTLEAGGAARISTGAEMPDGADAVTKQELVEAGEDAITVRAAVPSGCDLRRRGEVLKSTERVIGAGTSIGPVEIGSAATTGHDHLTCHRLPKVTLLVTGDELVEAGRVLEPGQIWNSNGPAIAATIEAAGIAELVAVEMVPDRREATREALTRSLESDLTAICGGVSVGDHDHVKPALAELGVEQDFWGLALKPGRPTWFGRRGASSVLGLPGNPVSALVVFRLLGLPLLHKLAGGRPGALRSKGTLAEPVNRLSDRLNVVPCRPPDVEQPGLIAPMSQLGSHDFLALRGATCLALIPPGDGRAEAGEEVETLPLEGL